MYSIYHSKVSTFEPVHACDPCNLPCQFSVGDVSAGEISYYTVNSCPWSNYPSLTLSFSILLSRLFSLSLSPEPLRRASPVVLEFQRDQTPHRDFPLLPRFNCVPFNPTYLSGNSQIFPLALGMASSDALPNNQSRVLSLVLGPHTIPTTTTTATRVAGFLFPLQRHSATKRSHLISSCTFVSTPPAVLISPRTRNGHALFAVVAIWLSIAIVLFACLSYSSYAHSPAVYR